MARGKTLRQLISDVRDEMRRANAASASPDDVASLRRTINHVQKTVFEDTDWPFLQTRFPRITLNAGQRYYDLPDGFDVERLTEIRVEYGGVFEPIARGISLDDYVLYNPENDERAGPVEKWDVQLTGVREQFEFWPLPDSSEQHVWIVGTKTPAELVNDDDVCPFESEIIVLYVAAELLPEKSPDKKAKLELAKNLLAKAKTRGNSSGGGVYKMGLGHTEQPSRTNAVIRVR